MHTGNRTPPRDRLPVFFLGDRSMKNPNTIEEFIAQERGRYTAHTVDIVKTNLYDRVTKEKKRHWPSTMHLFAYSIGQQDPMTSRIKTQIDTNMRRGNSLPPPSSFLIRRISFAFGADTDPAAAAILREESMWTFRLNERWYARDKLDQMQTAAFEEIAVFRSCDYCQAVHVLMQCPGCGSRNWTALHTEKVAHHGTEFFMDLNPPIYLPTMMQFYMIVETPNPPTIPLQFSLKCWLSGEEARGIQ